MRKVEVLNKTYGSYNTEYALTPQEWVRKLRMGKIYSNRTNITFRTCEMDESAPIVYIATRDDKTKFWWVFGELEGEILL